jgi:hypothetical protein
MAFAFRENFTMVIDLQFVSLIAVIAGGMPRREKRRTVLIFNFYYETEVML